MEGEEGGEKEEGHSETGTHPSGCVFQFQSAISQMLIEEFGVLRSRP